MQGAKSALSNSKCPCCAGDAKFVKNLPAGEIKNQMEALTGDSGIRSCNIVDYLLMQCCCCGVIFSDPMREPEPAFYDWLASFARYYPKSRWEWDACLNEIESLFNHSERRILDVGCGSGTFLELLASQPVNAAIGIDLNANAIGKCREKGLNAFQADLGSANKIMDGNFDVITFWHVIEHVSNPVNILRQARSLLSPQGVIFFSVPLSPPSYEACWTDPLNLPPHHLTRWNVEALTSLAEVLALQIHLILPRPDSFLTRSIRSILRYSVSPFESLGRRQKALRIVKSLITHPRLLPTALMRQLRRPRYAGRPLPDVALVRLGAQPS